MPWKAVTIVWPAIVAALLPLDLARLIARLPHLLVRLDVRRKPTGDDDRSRPRQLDDFRSQFRSRLSEAA
jgi:hypothetical protein